jgi:acetyl esterase/lipase
MHKKDLVYGMVHGAGLLADIASPDEGGPFPVILSVHGGRWIRENRYTNSSIDVEQWASVGFFAMNIEYRLLMCSPAPACYQDVQCAIRWVHAHADEYNLDTSRLFLIGMSAGGHLVSLAATLGDGNFPRTGGWEDAPNTITAAISSSGAYDLVNLPWGGQWIQVGKPWDQPLREASPMEYVHADMPPLMMLHSDNDGSVPIEQATRMADALEKAGARYEFKHYPDQGHIAIHPWVVDEARAFIDRVCRGDI